MEDHPYQLVGLVVCFLVVHLEVGLCKLDGLEVDHLAYLVEVLCLLVVDRLVHLVVVLFLRAACLVEVLSYLEVVHLLAVLLASTAYFPFSFALRQLSAHPLVHYHLLYWLKYLDLFEELSGHLAWCQVQL